MAREVKLIIKIDDDSIDEAVSALKRLKKSANEVSAEVKDSSGALDSFFGNFANDVVNFAIDALRQFAAVIADLTLESIRLGANFEITQNAMKIFAGSTRLANQELADISQTARDTAGLRLIPAEEGMQRLRGLGFEAERAKSLIKELSEEKILSGASNDALERVIFNFTQIASGGQKISQEIRELLTQMPSLRRAFLDAFGTLNPQKIQSLLDSNPNAFFDKLIASMEKTKGVQGGLNDAQDKFFDELIRSGREFSQPFLPQLTQSLRELTKDLQDNKETFKNWGKAVADVLTLVSRIGETRLFTLGKAFFDLQDRINTWTLTGGISAGMNAGELGENFRRGTDFLGITEKGKNYLTGETQMDRQAKAALQGAINASEAISEVETNMANQIFEANQKQERERQKALASLESYYSERLNVIENSSKIEEALINSRQTFTLDDEIKQVRDLAAAKSLSLRQQIAEQTTYFNRQIQLSDGSQQEIADITAKRNNTIRNLNAELAINEINAQKQIAEKERQILRQRRAAQIDFLELLSEEISNNYDNRIFDIDRAIKRELVQSNQGYNEIIELTRSKYDALRNYIRDQYAVRLQDESLSVEERKNLLKKQSLEEQKLTEESRRAILEIQDKQYEAELLRIEKQYDRIGIVISQGIQKIELIKNSLNPFTIDNKYVKNLGEYLFGGDYDELLQKTQKEIKDTAEAMQAANEQIYGKDTMIRGDDPALKIYVDRLDDLNKRLKVLQDGYANYDIALYRNIKAYNDGTITLREFQRVQQELFDKETFLNVQKMSSELDKLNVQYELARTANDEAKIKELADKIKQTENDRNNYIFDRTNQSAANYKDTIDGLIESLTNLQTAEANTIRKLNDEYQISYLKEQIDLYREIYRLQFELSQKGQLNQIEANAKVLRHINEEMKSVTDTAADFKISLYDNFTNVFTAPLDALEKRLESLPPLVRDLAQSFIDLARDIIKSFSHKLILRFLGLDTGSSSGGLNLGGGNGSGNLLQQIFGGGGNNGLFSGNQGNGIYSNNFSTNGGGNQSSTYAGLAAQLKNALNNSSYNSQLNTHEGIHAIGGGNGKFGLQGGLALAGVGASLLGGLIGGRAGNVLSGAGMGLSLGMAIGSIVPGLGTVVGGLIGAAAGGILGLFGGDPKRRRDKKEKMPQLTQGFADAIAELKQLLADTRSLRVDGDSAISQADEIRKQIAGGFNLTFESKKYRKVAAEQIKTKLIEADDIIKEIKLAAEISKGAADRNKRILPEFANGVYFADYFKPNGLVPGMFDAKDDIFAMISRGEMVLNPKQQAAVRNNAGFDVFQGAGIPNYPSAIKAAVPKMATGGIAGNGFVIKNAAPQPQNMTLELYGVTVNEQVEAYLTSDFGKRTQIKVMKNLKKSGDV